MCSFFEAYFEARLVHKFGGWSEVEIQLEGDECSVGNSDS